MSTASQQISRNGLLWQLVCVALVVLPHLTHLSLSITGLVVVCAVWRFWVWRGRGRFPHWAIRAVLVLIALVVVLTGYRSGAGISTTVGLLIAGFSLKLIELHRRRDALVMLYVAIMVTATTFLFDQSIWTALYVIFTLLVIMTTLLTLYSNAEGSFWQPLKKAGGFVLPALPLMVLLFLVMPRLGAFWEVRLDPATARTGLSDSMSPGDITKLLRSAQVAFRVSFAEAQPAQNSLYWRAIVLPDFDGRRWYNASRQSTAEQVSRTELQTSTVLSYELILEPNQKKWVPVLETVVGYPAALSRLPDATLMAGQKQLLRQQYTLQSSPALMLNPQRLDSPERYLSLPDGNPKARALAAQWRSSNLSAEAIIEQILQRYTASFIYTLEPPALSNNSIDDFLFETQKGFCGHFASATTYLLRLAGIPARVVTGYQGGEYNPFESYYTVRQYDAHAWLEAWIEGRGWVRIDPTAAVAPERVEQSADQAFAGQPGFLAERPLSALSGQGSLLGVIRLRWEAINYGWQRWVLNYHHQQAGLLQGLLGQVSVMRIALLLFGPFALVIGFIMLRQKLRSRLPKEDFADRQVRLLSDHFAPKGLARAPGETVRHYCQRLSGVLTDLQDELLSVADQYERLRYAGHVDKLEQKNLADICRVCRQRV
ncbi:DUF3488 and transglutaminase-like domain-containing protein [Neptuniibacter sp. CAU 1671]|uniref:transglutaminase TgpA family protein n=1 Tax=Neptuniibacter sp. CAU 1671 TaxID=3032593 RepID=UPI0023DC8C21|nr:DUF3488 and transglutaminase-like domain-containing protein [Neptuniibacter sp. CAU 1671]MDF2180912.1 DUF3488 and transglutaminase-like domain-containing protein [Neptuniibacter sp. CAU 1671]